MLTFLWTFTESRQHVSTLVFFSLSPCGGGFGRSWKAVPLWQVSAVLTTLDPPHAAKKREVLVHFQLHPSSPSLRALRNCASRVKTGPRGPSRLQQNKVDNILIRSCILSRMLFDMCIIPPIFIPNRSNVVLMWMYDWNLTCAEVSRPGVIGRYPATLDGDTLDWCNNKKKSVKTYVAY